MRPHGSVHWRVFIHVEGSVNTSHIEQCSRCIPWSFSSPSCNMWRIILFLCLPLFMSSNGYRCGHVCECIRQRHLISCSHRNLRNIPRLPQDPIFTGLDLSHNRIRTYPPPELLMWFQHIDLRGNPLNCSTIVIHAHRRVSQDSCDLNITSQSTFMSPDSADRKYGIVHGAPHSPSTSSSSENQQPILTIALSSVSGILGFIMFTSMIIGLYMKMRRRPRGDEDSITSSNVSLAIYFPNQEQETSGHVTIHSHASCTSRQHLPPPPPRPPPPQASLPPPAPPAPLPPSTPQAVGGLRDGEVHMYVDSQEDVSPRHSQRTPCWSSSPPPPPCPVVAPTHSCDAPVDLPLPPSPPPCTPPPTRPAGLCVHSRDPRSSAVSHKPYGTPSTRGGAQYKRKGLKRPHRSVSPNKPPSSQVNRPPYTSTTGECNSVPYRQVDSTPYNRVSTKCEKRYKCKGLKGNPKTTRIPSQSKKKHKGKK